MICYHAEQRFETAAPQIATTAKKNFLMKATTSELNDVSPEV
jgi:hypothetical protein